MNVLEPVCEVLHGGRYEAYVQILYGTFLCVDNS